MCGRYVSTREAEIGRASPIGGLTGQRKERLAIIVHLLRQIATNAITGHWVQLCFDFVEDDYG